MFSTISFGKSINYYLAITFGLSISLSVFIGLTGGKDSSYIAWGLLAMFFPAIAVLIMKFKFKEFPQVSGWRKFPFKWLPLALFVFPFTIHLICIPIESFLTNHSIPWDLDSRGLADKPLSGLTTGVLLNAVVGIISISIFAYFEEIGWRVWMLARLIDRYNVRKGVLIGAIIWALWHIPFVLSEIHHIEGTSKMWLILLNPLGHIGAGIVISWIWLSTKSIWLICLAHGSLNNWGQYAFKYIGDSEKQSLSEIPWLSVGLNLSLLLLGIIVFSRIKNVEEWINGYLNEH